MTCTKIDDSIRPPAELEEMWRLHPEVVKLGDPVLRQVARPVVRLSRQTQSLIERMTDAMRKANGIGLAAPQVGASTRIIVYDVGDGVQVMINPKIVARSGVQIEPEEGCLSIPGLQGRVARDLDIRVKAYDARNRQISRRASKLEARVIQHEIDHLDGVLFIDRAEPESVHWSLPGEEDEDELDATRE